MFRESLQAGHWLSSSSLNLASNKLSKYIEQTRELELEVELGDNDWEDVKEMTLLCLVSTTTAGWDMKEIVRKGKV